MEPATFANRQKIPIGATCMTAFMMLVIMMLKPVTHSTMFLLPLWRVYVPCCAKNNDETNTWNHSAVSHGADDICGYKA